MGKCPYCGKGRVFDDVTGFTKPLAGGGELIIENVPCKVCRKCGESFVFESTAVKFGKIIKHYTKFYGQNFVVDFQKENF